MQDFQRAAGVEWSDPVSDRLGEWDYRIVFTTGGPPFIELVEGPSGSPWDAGPGRSNGAIGRLTSGHASAGPAAGHLAPAIGKGQAGRPGPISHEPERGAEGSGLPSTQVDLGVAALLARLPNPGLGKPACIWQPSTRPSGSPCLARLGRRSDVTPCYASVTVHNPFRRAGTTHHGEDHPTRDPWSG
ncbi:hypothetical protein Sliba_78490 [Streptomyces nigrescens]|uniref:Uncharacterized protein n=1 Tax=Streptomyces nigrescens TaxID=1920 RepID=A0A640TZN8_STRNI|nr:hypothetical protein Sliba_78490 [Streptomyces libani subsp. libani]GGV96257.1 hypothetical protein GCM10010500_38580 [Streptomyces libani subsp. libani]